LRSRRVSGSWRPITGNEGSPLAAIRIIASCILAAIAYGIVHDQITARVCVEYFTIGHPPIFGTDDPTILAIGWGIVATWWVGLILGIGLAIAARLGIRPKRSAESLVRPIARLLLIMAVCATLAGVAGYIAASTGAVFLVGWLAAEVPPDRHVAFLADAWAHAASYAVGFIGGIVICVSVWRARGRPTEPIT
jgi:hypothetical protein